MARIHRFLFASWAHSHRYLVVPAVCCLILAAGCNSQPPGQNQASSPPKLSMAAEQGSDSSAPAANSASDAQTSTSNAGAAPCGRRSIWQIERSGRSGAESAPGRFGNQCQSLAGRQIVRFCAQRGEISQRLTADFNQTQLELAHDAAQLFIMAGAYDPARQVYTALQKAAEKAPDMQISTPAREIARSA